VPGIIGRPDALPFIFISDDEATMRMPILRCLRIEPGVPAFDVAFAVKLEHSHTG